MRPGRLRRRLAELLEAAGFDVNADELDTQQGAYRKMDGARWFGYCYRDERKIYIFSWDTMADCIKYGITVGDLEYPNRYEIHADH
jgi:hypothetical protein